MKLASPRLGNGANDKLSRRIKMQAKTAILIILVVVNYRASDIESIGEIESFDPDYLSKPMLDCTLLSDDDCDKEMESNKYRGFYLETDPAIIEQKKHAQINES